MTASGRALVKHLTAFLVMVLLTAGCGCAAPSPIPPAYQEARAFPSCVVPIYVATNVQDRPRVKAAFAEVGRLSGYRFRDSSYSNATQMRALGRLGGC